VQTRNAHLETCLIPKSMPGNAALTGSILFPLDVSSSDMGARRIFSRGGQVMKSEGRKLGVLGAKPSEADDMF